METQNVKDGCTVFTPDVGTHFEIKINSSAEKGFQDSCEDVIP